MDEVESSDYIIPSQPEVRALVFMDLSRSLVSGCYLPLYGDQVIWIYFWNEGVYKFCKTCGCVGHSTIRCTDSQFEANIRIHKRPLEFE